MTSAGARSLAQCDLVTLDDDAAYALFEAIRWCDTDGQPKCPKCESLKVHRHRTRRIFSCASCNSQFSATSGTYFHARKLSMQKILEGILTFANGAKGVAALEMSRSLDVSHKTAFVLEHKLREGVHEAVSDRKMSGEVEVDGVYLGGYLKPANWRENRRDRRLAKNQNGKRRVVVVIRERHGRTRTVVVRHEHHAVDLLKKIIKPGTTVYCDEAHSWDDLKYAGYDVRQVNHQECYSDDGRACTNWAESYNSRLRRAESGVYHHVAGPYLDLYADEMAWREDARRIDNGRQFLLLCLPAFTSGPSRFRGYWQRHRKK